MSKHSAQSPVDAFEQERADRLQSYAGDALFQDLSAQWLQASMHRQYVYNFDWLGRPIIQYPQDMVAMQELVWRVRPDLIIETGIAHGGSLVLSASLLAMLNDANEIQENLQRYKSLVVLVESARQIHESYVRQFTAAKKSWLDVMNAMRELSQNEYALNDVQHNFFGLLKRLRVYAAQQP